MKKFIITEEEKNRIRGLYEVESSEPMVTTPNVDKTSSVIIDSSVSLQDALSGKKIPDSIKKNLTIINVKYVGFDNKPHSGQLVCDKSQAETLKKIFNELYDIGYPIDKVRPVSFYNWDDDRSTEDNNTSCFNYRYIKSTKILSEHSYGKAIDINPKYNPFITSKGSIFPKNAVMKEKHKSVLTSNSDVIKIFEKYGWKWGGNWNKSKDYQHFSVSGR